MMKHEFERIAGYEVSDEDYSNIIEPMYMSVNLDKEAFVKTLDKKRFALETKKELVKKMSEIALHLKNTCDRYLDLESEKRLHAIAEEYQKRFTYKGHYHIHCKHTFEHLGECRGCSYPSEIEIYDKEYNTIETIKLV